jgi:hypothetical protein
MMGAGRASQSDAPPTHFYPAPDIRPVPVHWKHPFSGSKKSDESNQE